MNNKHKSVLAKYDEEQRLKHLAQFESPVASADHH
eukprot:CAMPEP_0175038728 /NCGR_PEP_ID=MMETSP0052_2-20121109/41_1 /TAXON_ID=51329 ORGANISM="Polytomella parva, Strain SAG 63-3" /NCGR_SAMPLE_ID=MMETSP0052_2 /ASSEMBLY_ACC=CAM_ASM_000194 /LENGTH=34 /DNA_ID= /DNA_START= /DNA_END= /DNA_ORIENTATION=